MKQSEGAEKMEKENKGRSKRRGQSEWRAGFHFSPVTDMVANFQSKDALASIIPV
jgi:hypothetical protein